MRPASYHLPVSSWTFFRPIFHQPSTSLVSYQYFYQDFVSCDKSDFFAASCCLAEMRGAMAPNRPWGAMGTLVGAFPLAEGVRTLRRWGGGLPMSWGALLGVVLLAGGSGGLQRWAHQPPYTEANPGEEVLMPCIVQNIQVGNH